ncbi:MAG: hypothetical protein HYV07_30210 [Deltaproteobacteria bacterium]|nr:hypothetical protein [Deltaproteobacteria bacterium]
MTRLQSQALPLQNNSAKAYSPGGTSARWPNQVIVRVSRAASSGWRS